VAKVCVVAAAILRRVLEMLPRCAEAGISVKYGRKVLQRLQAVGPARKALSTALAARTPRLPDLEEALGAAKVCRCLLEDDLLQVRGLVGRVVVGWACDGVTRVVVDCSVVSKMAFLGAHMGDVASTARLTVAVASAHGYMHISKAGLMVHVLVCPC
jgi:hypothetical protein